MEMNHQERALKFLLGYLEEETWDDAIVETHDKNVRRAILNLRNQYGA